MKVTVISGKSKEWDAYISKLDHSRQDIYYTNWYHNLMAEETASVPIMFVCEDLGAVGMYPFLKKPIEGYDISGSYYDIETAYGYGGPLIEGGDEAFRAGFEAEFLKYCRDENIIAEFIRFHPLLDNENIFKTNIDVLHNRKTVWVDLEQTVDDIWMKQISTKNRNVIRKCEKTGLVVEPSCDYELFVDIYNETMHKVGAGGGYFFSSAYFDEMKNHEHCVLLMAKKDGEAVAAAIFMMYGEYFHYHLSGSRQQALSLSPNNILLWEAIKYGKAKGCKRMHLGGGLRDDESDTLFRFKSKYSHSYADFYIGKRVHNAYIYRELIKQWEHQTKKKAGILLQYRE